MNHTNGWKSLEKPQTTMIAKMIRAKTSILEEIIRAKMVAPPIEVEALARSISFLHNTWALPRDRYTRMALESSRKLAINGDKTCWYAQMTAWLDSHGISMTRLPLFNTL